MTRLRRLSRPGWLTAGLLAGAVLGPGLAVAATATLVNVRGNDHTAYVTPANQLRTADTDPANLFSVSGSGAAGTCVALPAVGGTQSLVVKQLLVDVTSVGTGGDAFVDVIAGPNCTGNRFASVDVTQRGLVSVPLGSGFPVRNSVGLSAQLHGADAIVKAFGYTVPGTAVPAGAASLHRSAGAAR